MFSPSILMSLPVFLRPSAPRCAFLRHAPPALPAGLTHYCQIRCRLISCAGVPRALAAARYLRQSDV
jgi:hypothetical protein